MYRLIIFGTILVWLAIISATAVHFSNFERYAVRQDMKELVIANTEIDAILNGLLKETGSDRIALDRFHDTVKDVQGNHFLYASRTNEVARPGVSTGSGSTVYHNWLISLFNSIMVDLAQNHCVFTPEVTIKSQYYDFYRDIGKKADIRCPVMSREGNLIAFIVGEYVRPIPLDELKTKEAILREAASRIADILGSTTSDHIQRFVK